jgi:hypothetical protein
LTTRTPPGQIEAMIRWAAINAMVGRHTRSRPAALQRT